MVQAHGDVPVEVSWAHPAETRCQADPEQAGGVFYPVRPENALDPPEGANSRANLSGVLATLPGETSCLVEPETVSSLDKTKTKPKFEV